MRDWTERPIDLGALHVFYRLSDGSYDKLKPDYISKRICLENFLSNFSRENFTLIADNVVDDTWEMLGREFAGIKIERTSFGNGAASFNRALDLALKLPQEDIVYFVEDDYLHCPNSRDVLLEGMRLGTDYLTLYDHPDKFMDTDNPHVDRDGEVTKVFLSASCHWKLTSSTTMTYASTVKTLTRDEAVIRARTSGDHPDDFNMFIDLREKGRTLISPLPGYATHGQIEWLGPLVDWEEVALK